MADPDPIVPIEPDKDSLVPIGADLSFSKDDLAYLTSLSITPMQRARLMVRGNLFH